MTIYYYPWADWVQAIGTWALFLAALAAGILAGFDLWTNRRQLKTLRDSTDSQLFSALLQEISGDEASLNRGMVVKYVQYDADVDEIKNKVEGGRQLTRRLRQLELEGGKTSTVRNDALIGIGIEKTIACYDRVGFFLLDSSTEELRMKPPDWLWTHIYFIWFRLYKWIDHRDSNKNDTEYYHPNYAVYLRKLANRKEVKSLNIKP